MNILQICSARQIGGGERHFADLVNGLSTRGHRVHVALSENSEVAELLSALPQEHIFRLSRGLSSVSNILQVSRLVREASIDIIHAHAARDYPLAALVSRWAGNSPYVLTRHVLFPMKRLNRLMLGRVSRVIAVSRAVGEGLRNQGIFHADKVIVISNGIDVERFACRRDNKAETTRHDRLLVGTIGHLAPIKGQTDFVEAAALIASRRDDVDFVIVGEDKSYDGHNRAELERMIERRGLTKRIRMTGWVDDVRDVLDTLDVFVSPSRAEPFGLVMPEAMAARVPVVATRSEGAVEIIDDNRTGRLVPIGDTIALADTVTELLSDRTQRETLGHNALEVARVRFSLQRMVEETEAVYCDVLKGP